MLPPAQDANTVAGDVISFVLGALGIVAVLFIVYGGIQYSMSAGEPAKMEKAKKTILYAVIGLIVAIMAFAIVRFVVAQVGGSTEAETESTGLIMTIAGGLV